MIHLLHSALSKLFGKSFDSDNVPGCYASWPHPLLWFNRCMLTLYTINPNQNDNCYHEQQYKPKKNGIDDEKF